MTLKLALKVRDTRSKLLPLKKGEPFSLNFVQLRYKLDKPFTILEILASRYFNFCFFPFHIINYSVFSFQISDMALCIMDENEKISNMAKLFFTELSRKGIFLKFVIFFFHFLKKTTLTSLKIFSLQALVKF